MLGRIVVGTLVLAAGLLVAPLGPAAPAIDASAYACVLVEWDGGDNVYVYDGWVECEAKYVTECVVGTVLSMVPRSQYEPLCYM